MSRHRRGQGVEATAPGHAAWVRRLLRAMAGVLRSRVGRGLALRLAATLARSAAVCTDRSLPLANQWRSSRLVFSLVPRCQGECGSQKYRVVFNAIWMSA